MYQLQAIANQMYHNQIKNSKKPEQTKINYKKYQEIEKSKEKFIKEKEARAKEYLDELKGKVSFNINELPNPLPVQYSTFDKYRKSYDTKEKKTSKKKSQFISLRFRCR